jgi:hypothetical protein
VGVRRAGREKSANTYGLGASMSSDSRGAKASRCSWAAPEQSPLPPSPRRANQYFSPLTKAVAERAEARKQRTRGDTHSDDDSEGEDARTTTRAEADTPPPFNSEDCADHAARKSVEDRDVNALARQLTYITLDFASTESKPSGWKPTVRTPVARKAGTSQMISLDFK